MRRVVSWIAFAAILVVHEAGAQQLPPAADSAVARASRMVSDGDSVGARKLLDSLSSKGDSPLVRAEAVYQRAQVATSASEREALLGGLVIDYSFSPRVAPALFELGMAELERNDRDRAAVHLGRYLSASVAPDSGRIPASLALGRLLLERGELPRGCATLLIGRSELPESALELKTQFEFSIGRCQGVDTTSKPEPKPTADTVPAPQRTGAFTVQVAAYDTKKGADRLVASLRAQGLDARVVGTAKPFRVRVGRYATRADAEEASRHVDVVAKSKSIVVIVGPEER
jgi:hypothetical protein